MTISTVVWFTILIILCTYSLERAIKKGSK
jgi:hypothetical protein